MHLKEVFHKLDKYGLTINTSKSVFNLEFSFWGIWSINTALPNKVYAIQEFPLLENIKQKIPGNFKLLQTISTSYSSCTSTISFLPV